MKAALHKAAFIGFFRLARQGVGDAWGTDCHTSDVGHWFAMTHGKECGATGEIEPHPYGMMAGNITPPTVDAEGIPAAPGQRGPA